MKMMTATSLRNHMKEALESVMHGDQIAISLGKKKQKVALLIPFVLKSETKRSLGILENKAKCTIKPDFKLTEEEFLRL